MTLVAGNKVYDPGGSLLVSPRFGVVDFTGGTPPDVMRVTYEPGVAQLYNSDDEVAEGLTIWTVDSNQAQVVGRRFTFTHVSVDFTGTAQRTLFVGAERRALMLTSSPSMMWLIVPHSTLTEIVAPVVTPPPTPPVPEQLPPVVTVAAGPPFSVDYEPPEPGNIEAAGVYKASIDPSVQRARETALRIEVYARLVGDTYYVALPGPTINLQPGLSDHAKGILAFSGVALVRSKDPTKLGALATEAAYRVFRAEMDTTAEQLGFLLNAQTKIEMSLRPKLRELGVAGF